MGTLAGRLRGVVGGTHVSADPDVLSARSVDWTGRYRGAAALLVRPGSGQEVAAVLGLCREAGAFVTVQGGRTSLVAGTVPEHDDVLLSTERLTAVGAVDPVQRRIRVGAGVTLADLQRAASGAGLLFGVDLAARDSATVGGMASTNAGGLRTVRYGAMADQVTGLEVALPDGSLFSRHPTVASDNTGYDMTGLFVGAEGTLGVITEVDLRLRPTPRHRIGAICGFDDLDALVSCGRDLRESPTIAALELLDGRAVRLAERRLGLPAPMRADWLLLVEMAGDTDQSEPLAAALDGQPMSAGPAVGADPVARQRLWRTRESVAEVVGLFGPPLKFDVALPLAEISGFAGDADALIGRLAPKARPVLFGHVGEGNLHLNVLGCTPDEEAALYAAMMGVISARGGNVSSEHGVGSRKRAYLSLARGAADIAAMRRVKAAFDPTGYLNPAVLFD